MRARLRRLEKAVGRTGIPEDRGGCDRCTDWQWILESLGPDGATHCEHCGRKYPGIPLAYIQALVMEADKRNGIAYD